MSLPPNSINGNAWGIPGFTVQNETWPAPTGGGSSALPAWVKIVNITGTYVDGATGLPLAGVIKFSPTKTQIIASGGTVITLRTVKAMLVDGLLSVNLLASDDPDNTPNFLYSIKEAVLGGRTYLANVPNDQGDTIDITDLPEANPIS